MFKKTDLSLPNVSRLKLKFSNFSGGINKTIDENLLPINYAKCSYNTDFKDKSLKTGLGFKQLTLPKKSTEGEHENLNYLQDFGNIDSVWAFYRYDNNLNRKADIIFVHADDNKLYHHGLYTDIPGFSTPSTFTYVGKPNVLFHKYNNFDVAILSSESDSLAIWTGAGAPQKVQNTLNLTSICVHYERLFATIGGKKNMVRFSDDFDLAEWDETPTEGGFIELVDERGTLNKVISFNDYVYIIREHGISRLSAYGDQAEFSVTHLFLSTDKIYENTTILCGDRIMMICSDGLYCFNGYTASKYDLKINEMFVMKRMNSAVASYFDGKYYLACCLDFKDNARIGCEQNDSYTNNALIEFDIKTGQYTITRGVDIIDMEPIVDSKLHKLAVVFGDPEHRKVLGELTHDGKFFGTPLPKNWTSPLSDFGYPDKLKIVREIHLLSPYDLTLTVSSESESKTIQVKGSDKTIKVFPNVQGYRISISFDSTASDFYVSNPNVVVDLV